MSITDVLAIVILCGLIASFVLHFPVWLNVILLLCCVAEFFLLIKRHGR